MRLTPAPERVLLAVAAADHRSVSQFVIDSALVRAEEVLPSRRNFGIHAEKWEALMAALDAERRYLPRVEKLFERPGVFDSTEESRLGSCRPEARVASGLALEHCNAITDRNHKKDRRQSGKRVALHGCENRFHVASVGQLRLQNLLHRGLNLGRQELTVAHQYRPKKRVASLGTDRETNSTKEKARSVKAAGLVA